MFKKKFRKKKKKKRNGNKKFPIIFQLIIFLKKKEKTQKILKKYKNGKIYHKKTQKYTKIKVKSSKTVTKKSFF